jgi:hypothetical protein
MNKGVTGLTKFSKGVLMAVLVLGISLGASQVRAESSLERDVRELKQKLQALETKLDQQSSEAEEPILTLLKGIKMSGNVATSINYNFNEPDSRVNALRIFDTEANTFNLDLFELVIEKEAPEEGVGFRVDLNYGDVAESIGSTGMGSTTDEFDLQQAYISLNAPVGIDNLSFTIGKFVTLLGYELIESWDNLNTSRSYLFGYAIPFTHTGILGNYALNDELDFSLGVVNGWDNADDNNDAKTVLARIGINPTDKLSLGITGIHGAEQTANNSAKRTVVDLVATLQATDKLTLGLNYDHGYEEDGLAVDRNATWEGIAGYAHYQLSDRWGLALRGEYFDDDEGVRTGTVQELWEVTLTNDYKIYDNLLLRLEYRHDESNTKSFTEKTTSVDTQETVSMELVYSF